MGLPVVCRALGRAQGRRVRLHASIRFHYPVPTKMRNLILALMLLLSNAAQNQVYAQTFSDSELREVADLYMDGQYVIVKAKLSNAGFNLTETTPDYTLNGVNHNGVFTMKREKESSSKGNREIDFKDLDRFFFSTTTGPNFLGDNNTILREAEVQFNYADRSATYTYNIFCAYYSDAVDSTYSLCNPDLKCRRFIQHGITKGRNPVETSGEQRIETFKVILLTTGDKSVTNNGTAPYLLGSFTQKSFYSKLPVDRATRPPIRKPASRKK